MLRMICRVTLRNKVASVVTALRMGVDELEEHLRQKRLRWFKQNVRRDEEVEIKKVLELRIEERRKRGRPMKRWTDVVEENMKKRGVVQQGAWDVALKEAAVDPCSVWKEGECELNPLCNMWLLGA